MNINETTLNELITRYSEDKEILDIIYNTLTAVEEYHSAILKMEAWTKVYSYKSVDKDEYQQNVTDSHWSIIRTCFRITNFRYNFVKNLGNILIFPAFLPHSIIKFVNSKILKNL
jgi:hypothetical protein